MQSRVVHESEQPCATDRDLESAGPSVPRWAIRALFAGTGMRPTLGVIRFTAARECSPPGDCGPAGNSSYSNKAVKAQIGYEKFTKQRQTFPRSSLPYRTGKMESSSYHFDQFPEKSL